MRTFRAMSAICSNKSAARFCGFAMEIWFRKIIFFFVVRKRGSVAVNRRHMREIGNFRHSVGDENKFRYLFRTPQDIKTHVALSAFLKNRNRETLPKAPLTNVKKAMDGSSDVYSLSSSSRRNEKDKRKKTTLGGAKKEVGGAKKGAVVKDKTKTLRDVSISNIIMPHSDLHQSSWIHIGA